MTKVAAMKEIKAAKVQAIRDSVAKRIKAVSSLEEFSQARLLELAQLELSSIVAASEREAGGSVENGGKVKPTRFKYACPHCNKVIMYKGKRGGKTFTCPYKQCGRPFAVPALPEAGSNIEEP